MLKNMGKTYMYFPQILYRYFRFLYREIYRPAKFFPYTVYCRSSRGTIWHTWIPCGKSYWSSYVPAPPTPRWLYTGSQYVINLVTSKGKDVFTPIRGTWYNHIFCQWLLTAIFFIKPQKLIRPRKFPVDAIPWPINACMAYLHGTKKWCTISSG